MNKKGFTLVELLAVIAILAILVIIALPNVMGMFNTAKENSFTTEAKTILQQAEQQWISDSIFGAEERTYVRDEDEKSCSFAKGSSNADETKKIDLSGRTSLAYEITVDKSGKVTVFKATDGTYAINGNSSDGIKATDIGTDTVKIEKLASGATAPSITSCSGTNTEPENP